MSSALKRAPSSASARKSGSMTLLLLGVRPLQIAAAPANQRPVVISSGSAKPGSTASTCAPSAFELAHRGGDRGGDLRMHVLRIAEGRREGDAQAADAVVEALQVVARRRTAARSSRARRDASARSSSAPHRPRSCVCGPRCATRAHRRERIGRHPAEARLQAEEAAEASRDAHVPAPSVPTDERPHVRPRPPRRCRPRSRPASSPDSRDCA